MAMALGGFPFGLAGSGPKLTRMAVDPGGAAGGITWYTAVCLGK
jgi:hypothetical protein